MNLTDCELLNEDVSDQIKNDMLSTVMSLYWGAKRSRPDILFNVSYLENRVKYANSKDIKILCTYYLILKAL